ncbi:MAG: fibronectin type III domain-containing protein [Gemmatimonadota bacterium]|nr:fibronectin type III domain-containing protein [Gemmatimonadota bacterium]
MKTNLHTAILAVLSVLLPPPSDGHASSEPADSVHFCLPVDPEQLQRDAPHPAGKWASDLNVGEPRTVRLFYFLPNDRPYRAEVVDSMKAGILDLQTFYAEQMETHGHGYTTFQIESDDQGDPAVHVVDGDYGDSRYSSRGYTDGEIGRAFDNASNIILIVMDVSASSAHGRGTGVKDSGWAMVYGEWNWFAAAHELGHAFGLQHDFRDNEFIMSYGRADRSTAKLSACAAEFLAAHPYLNSDVPLENASPPTVELVSSEYPFGSASTSVQLRVRDDDGLHQVILFVRPKNPFLGGTPEVKACDGLSGETNTVVEFNFDGRLPSDNVGTAVEAHTTLSNTVLHPIYVVAVDTAGNRTSTVSLESFTLEAGHSPQHIATLERPNFYDIGDFAFSPVGAYLAIGESGRVELLDATKRETIATFHHSANTIPTVAFSPDGTLLAAGSKEGTIRVWNVTREAEVATLVGHADQVASLDFSPEGSLLASGSFDQTVMLWNATNWTKDATLEGHTERVAKTAFVRDGKLASVSVTGTVRLWKVSTRTQISTIETGARGAVAVSKDGTLVASPISWAVKLWDLATGAQTGAVNDMRDYNRAYPVFSPDGTILAVTAFGLIELWDISKRELLASISGGPGGVRRMVFSPDGRMLIGNDARSNSRQIKFWDVSEWTASITPVSQRTSQVREAILGVVRLNDPGVSSFAQITATHLDGITALYLNGRGITSLKSGDFDGLTSLEELLLFSNQLTSLPEDIFSGLSSLQTLRFGLNQLTTLPSGLLDGLTALTDLRMIGNRMTALPDSIFVGLTGLTRLSLGGNAVNPLPLNVSLEKTGEGQFKAVAPAGAPFDIVLPLNVTNGSISGGATRVTIPAGSVESDTLNVTRTPATTFAATVDIGTLPALPANHSGYALVKSADLPLAVTAGAVVTQVWSGTATGGTWGNDFGNGNATGFGYSRHHNAGSISNPTFSYNGATYTIHGINISRIGNNLTHQISLLISPGFSSCDRKLLSFSQLSSSGGLALSDAGEGSAYGASWYLWRERSHMAWPVGFQYSWKITLHPTAPDSPIATAIVDGNQVTLHWTTPCDGGIAITRHEYREKAGTGSFGSWMPVPNSGAGGVNEASYTVTGLNNPSQYTFEVRAVNTVGEGGMSAEAMVSSLPAVPLAERTAQVRDGIVAAVPDISDSSIVTEAHLAAITRLRLGYQNISALKPGDFSGLTGLTRLHLAGNQLSSLPDGIFAGLTSLAELRLGGNPVDPLPLPVSLEKVGADQVKAAAPAGAPFDIVLPLSVTSGSISGGATTITIPRGSVESQPLTVTRTSGTTAAVTVDIGTLPGLPNGHFGYALVKSSDLPLEIFGTGVTGRRATTDFNGDGRTDFVDFFLFADAYGSTNAKFDLDGNGTVDFADFFRFVDAFGA